MNALLRLLPIIALHTFLAATASAAGTLFWTDASEGELGVAGLDGSNPVVLLDSLDTPDAVAVEPIGAKVYWSEGTILSPERAIRRANLDGSGAETVIPDSVLAGTVAYLALDPGAGKLYWADESKIVRSDLDGSSRESLVTSANAGAIALDLEAGHLYWTDRSAFRIRRAFLDGSNATDVLSTGTAPLGLGVDPGGRTLYWTEGGSIWSADYDGGNAQVLFSSFIIGDLTLDLTDDRILFNDLIGGPAAVDIDGGGASSPLPSADHFAIHRSTGDLRKIYWSENSPERIRRAGIDGCLAEDVVASGLTDVRDLAVDEDSGQLFWVDWAQRDVSSSNLDGTGVTVVVDDGGLWVSSVDVDVPGDWIYWRSSESFFRVHRDGSGQESLGNIHGAQTGSSGDLKLDPLGGMIYATYSAAGLIVRFPSSGGATDTLVSSSSGCIALDPMGGKMYWGTSSELRRSDLDGSGEELLVAGVTPAEVELDVDAGKIYWLTSTSVWRANVDGSNRRRVLHGLDNAAGLALSVSPTFDNKIYWTGNGQIRRVGLDGGPLETVVSSGLSSPQGIAYEPVDNKIYWTDVGLDRIRRSNLDGSDVEDVVTSGLNYARDLGVDWTEEKVYWVDRGANRVGRADYDGQNFEVLYTGVDDPKGMDLDLAARKIYWGDNITNRIARGDMDGSGPIETVVAGTPHPYGVALDYRNSRVYWTDDVDNTVERAYLDGTGREVLVSGLSQPLHLYLDLPAGKMYWTENAAREIQRANLDGSGMETVVSTVSSCLGIFLLAPGVHPVGVTETNPVSAPLASLRPPFPNPFRAGTSLALHHRGGDLGLAVYDVSGRLVQVLHRGAEHSGDHLFTWDGRDHRGRVASPGVYFFRYRSETGTARTVKGILLR